MTTNLVDMLPAMMFGEELRLKMQRLPEYKDEFRQMEPGKRLLKLMDLYQLFYPQTMATEIYSQLYMMTVLSMKKKGTREAVQQLNANYQASRDEDYYGIITGASSASIVGESGVGKTSCIQRTVDLLGPVIHTNQPLQHVIPALVVQCPFDANYKQLLLTILARLDEALGSNYYAKTQRSAYNAQQILMLVASLCLHHIGVLIIDEVQALMEGGVVSGNRLYRMILQLINSSGISVVFAGTNECLDFFQQNLQISRRMAGLRYQNLEYGKDFRELTETMFRYQYTRQKTELTEGLLSWLYEHTAGNVGNLQFIFASAQQIAITKGTEKLDITVLTDAYNKRMQMLHPYIEPQKMKLPATGKRKKKAPVYIPEEKTLLTSVSIRDIVLKAKNLGEDIVTSFREHFVVEEVIV